ncbi:MAG: Ig-like domain repeat protein, partial [Candidatus Dormibacteraeota bacterium]|nr:Ig-like domain repeat protein [Candidatus Dormibacteraeota bacterium]
YPHGLSVDRNGNLYTADHNNNRVLEYPGVVPTGTITFSIDGTTVATRTVGTGGSVAYSTSTLAVGAHQVTATYSGDSNFAGSTTTPALVQTVESPTPSVPNTGAPAWTGARWILAGTMLAGGGLATAVAGRRRRAGARLRR